jgi:hypothetical protein
MYEGLQLKSKRQRTGWNLKGRSMTAPPPVLSPINILPLPSSHCAFIRTRESSARIQKSYYLLTFLTKTAQD